MRAWLEVGGLEAEGARWFIALRKTYLGYEVSPSKSHLTFCKERGTFLRSWLSHLIPSLQTEALCKD